MRPYLLYKGSGQGERRAHFFMVIVTTRSPVLTSPYGKGRCHAPFSCLPFLTKGRCHGVTEGIRSSETETANPSVCHTAASSLCTREPRREIVVLRQKRTPSQGRRPFLEQVTRVSPLAARPAKQHTVLFVLPWSVAERYPDRAKCSLPLAAPPSTLVSSRFTPKKNASVRKASFLEQVTRVELAGISLGS